MPGWLPGGGGGCTSPGGCPGWLPGGGGGGWEVVPPGGGPIISCAATYGCGFEMKSENDCAPITVAAGASTTMSAAVMSCLLNGSCIGRYVGFLLDLFGVPRYGTEVPRLWIEAKNDYT